MLMFGAVGPARASFPRTLSANLAVTIPDHGNPVDLVLDSEAIPYQGFSEVAVLNQAGNVSFVGPSPSYFLNGSIDGYGYFNAGDSLPMGSGAYKILYVPEVNTFYVLNGDENSVIAFKGGVDASNGTSLSGPQVIANTTVGKEPSDECYSAMPSGALVYVLSYLSGSIAVINATTNQMTDSFTTSIGYPTAIACGWNGALFAVTGTGALADLNGTTGATIGTLSAVVGVISLTFNPDSGLLYAVDPTDKVIQVVNSTSLRVVDNITTSAVPGPLVVDAPDDVVFASTGSQILALDGTTSGVIANFSTAEGPYALAVDPINHYLYEAYEAQDSIAIYAFSIAAASQTSTVTSTATEHQTVTMTTTATTTTTATSVRNQPTTVPETQTLALIVLLAIVALESVYLGFGIRRRKSTSAPEARNQGLIALIRNLNRRIVQACGSRSRKPERSTVGNTSATPW